MSIAKFQDNLNTMVVAYAHETYKWSGDIIDCSDYAKDRFCYQFLLHAESWWNDILPPIIINQAEFIDMLYSETHKCLLSNIIRGDIYLYLESGLREMVQESFNTLHNIQPEPFAGYERGE